MEWYPMLEKYFVYAGIFFTFLVFIMCFCMNHYNEKDFDQNPTKVRNEKAKKKAKNEK